ncbi:hypothetical protein MPER_10917 [Moniliophthora perniciosa FA553]|nr:hypothetical protein MPER_10917 [Moniliophthora perniciosa FA553]
MAPRGAKNIPAELWDKMYVLPSIDENQPEGVYLYQLSLSQLKALCLRYRGFYGLKVSGNKSDLLQSLLDLSEDKQRWNSNQPAAKRTHKGQQPGSKKSSTKWGYKQRLEAAGVILPPTDTTTQRIKNTRTEADMDSEMAYIKLYMSRHQEYYKLMPPIASANSRTSKQDLATQINNIDAKLDLLVDSRTHRIPDTMDQAPPSITIPPPIIPSTSSLQPVLASSTIAVPVTDTASIISTGSDITSQSYPGQVSEQEGAPDGNNSPRMKTLHIWPGTEHEKILVFDQTKVPTPPSISFHKNLDELGRLWSKANPGFNEKDCVVKIGDHGIAYQHWPTVFKHKVKNLEDRRWKKLRKTWDVWRLIGQYYTTQGKKKFWEEFTIDGKPMSQTAIAEILRVRSPNSKKGKARGDGAVSDTVSGAVAFPSHYSSAY